LKAIINPLLSLTGWGNNILISR